MNQTGAAARTIELLAPAILNGSSCLSRRSTPCVFMFFFFNDTATTEIYTLSLHDALPISDHPMHEISLDLEGIGPVRNYRSEEHTSELQSRSDLVCRLLLEKKKKNALFIVDDRARVPPAPLKLECEPLRGVIVAHIQVVDD